MSADSTLVFIGVRYDVPAEGPEVEALETRTDPRIQWARRHKLDHWWGRFGRGPALFIGRKLAVVGIEGTWSMSLAPSELEQVIADVQRAFSEGGHASEVRLHVEYQPD